MRNVSGNTFATGQGDLHGKSLTRGNPSYFVKTPMSQTINSFFIDMHNLSVNTLATGQGDLHGKSLTRGTSSYLVTTTISQTISLFLTTCTTCESIPSPPGKVICMVNRLRGATLHTYSKNLCAGILCLVGSFARKWVSDLRGKWLTPGSSSYLLQLRVR